MPGVIDEFLLGVKMEGDPSGLVEAYKKIFDLQEEYNRREREREEQEEQDSENESKRGQGLIKIKQGVSAAASKGVGVLKQGVSIARGWAVALLAVDGAAMAVVGRLSQMAVEYQNVAGATGTSSEAMKAWEDTFKAAGGSADDVQSSLKQLYEGARNFMYNQADEAFVQAMGDFNVRIADESGNMRDTADIFADIIASAQSLIEGGADRSFVLTRLAGAGVSEKLIEPLLSQQPEGGYRVSGEAYQKYYGRAEGMTELADASREISESATELSSVVRSKLTAVLTRMVESGMLTDLLDRITAFIEGIDPDKVAETIDNLIIAIEKVINWVEGWAPGAIEGVKNISGAIGDIRTRESGTEAEKQDLRSSAERADMIMDAIRAQLGGMGSLNLIKEFGAMKLGSEGMGRITENEARMMAQSVGLNIERILGNINNEINIYMDNVKQEPTRVEQRTTGASGYGGVQEQ